MAEVNPKPVPDSCRSKYSRFRDNPSYFFVELRVVAMVAFPGPRDLCIRLAARGFAHYAWASMPRFPERLTLKMTLIRRTGLRVWLM